jgi:flagella basal body P-ring formation protein FlgA
MSLRAALLVLLAFGLGGTAEAASLKATTLAVDEQVRLSDLFDDIAGDAVVSAAPLPGRTLTLTTPQLLRIAQTYALDWRPVGGERVVITRREVETAVPVLARRLAAGEVIQASDLTTKQVPARLVTRQIVTDAGLIAGRSARRNLQAETPLQKADLMAPQVVRRGEPVSITLDDGQMLLVAQGEALMDGALGERIRVVNPSSKKSIEATVIGTGQVAVDPPLTAAQPASGPAS